MCWIRHQNQDCSQARMAGTNMSINMTNKFQSEEVSNKHIYTYNCLRKLLQPIERQDHTWESTSRNTLWIPDMADHYLTTNQPEDQGCEADYLHLTELRYRPRVTRPRPSTRTKKIGRIMDRRRFRFHAAHVRSVRITVNRWSIQLGKRERKLITLRCNNSKTRHYWPKNKFPSASC